MSPRRHAPEEVPDEDNSGPLFAQVDHCGWCGLNLERNPKHDVDYCRRFAASFDGVHMSTERLDDSKCRILNPNPAWMPIAHEAQSASMAEADARPLVLPSKTPPAIDPSASYRDAVAARLLARPGEWVDGMELARLGGAYAWRTRISDARIQLGLDIENRQRKEGKRTVSEYRVRPAPEEIPDFPLPASPPGR